MDDPARSAQDRRFRRPWRRRTGPSRPPSPVGYAYLPAQVDKFEIAPLRNHELLATRAPRGRAGRMRRPQQRVETRHDAGEDDGNLVQGRYRAAFCASSGATSSLAGMFTRRPGISKSTIVKPAVALCLTLLISLPALAEPPVPAGGIGASALPERARVISSDLSGQVADLTLLYRGFLRAPRGRHRPVAAITVGAAPTPQSTGSGRPSSITASRA